MPEARLAKARASYKGYVYQPPQPPVPIDYWKHYFEPAIRRMKQDQRRTNGVNSMLAELVQRVHIEEPDMK